MGDNSFWYHMASSIYGLLLYPLFIFGLILHLSFTSKTKWTFLLSASSKSWNKFFFERFYHHHLNNYTPQTHIHTYMYIYIASAERCWSYFMIDVIPLLLISWIKIGIKGKMKAEWGEERVLKPILISFSIVKSDIHCEGEKKGWFRTAWFACPGWLSWQCFQRWWQQVQE